MADEPATPEWVAPTSTKEALRRVEQSVGAIAKESKQGVNYKFRTIDGLYEALQEHLGREGLIIRLHHHFMDFDTSGNIGGNSNTTRLLLEYEASAVSPWDDESVSLGSCMAIGQDTSDKGPGKAHSYAYKTIVSSAFSIPTQGDPDRADVEDNETPQGWHGWASQDEHNATYKALMDRKRALPETLDQDMVGKMLVDAQVFKDGGWVRRITPAVAQRYDQTLRVLESLEAPPTIPEGEHGEPDVPNPNGEEDIPEDIRPDLPTHCANGECNEELRDDHWLGPKHEMLCHVCGLATTYDSEGNTMTYKHGPEADADEGGES